MKITTALAVLLFASIAQGQTVVTANPTAIDFGSLFPGEFASLTITYTCAMGPCVGAAPKITGGHTVLASSNTCKTNWTYFVPGQTGDTCSVSWTLKATNAEVDCPENVCTGTVGISVTNGVSNDGVIASDAYTATVLNPKPLATVSPMYLDFGQLLWNGPVSYDGPYFTTVTNSSPDVSLVVTSAVTGEAFQSNSGTAGNGWGPDTPDTCPGVTIAPGGSCTVGALFYGTYISCDSEQINKLCVGNFKGTLKIWVQSVIDGVTGKSVFAGRVELTGQTLYDGPGGNVVKR